jgi:hypothetical protein
MGVRNLHVNPTEKEGGSLRAKKRKARGSSKEDEAISLEIEPTSKRKQPDSPTIPQNSQGGHVKWTKIPGKVYH